MHVYSEVPLFTDGITPRKVSTVYSQVRLYRYYIGKLVQWEGKQCHNIRLTAKSYPPSHRAMQWCLNDLYCILCGKVGCWRFPRGKGMFVPFLWGRPQDPQLVYLGLLQQNSSCTLALKIVQILVTLWWEINHSRRGIGYNRSLCCYSYPPPQDHPGMQLKRQGGKCMKWTKKNWNRRNLPPGENLSTAASLPLLICLRVQS